MSRNDSIGQINNSFNAFVSVCDDGIQLNHLQQIVIDHMTMSIRYIDESVGGVLSYPGGSIHSQDEFSSSILNFAATVSYLHIFFQIVFF